MNYIDSLQVIEECQKKITASPNLPYVVCELKALSNAKVDLSISVLFIYKRQVLTTTSYYCLVAPKLDICVVLCLWCVHLVTGCPVCCNF